MTAEKGTFTETGNDAGLKAARKMGAAVLALSLTGNAAALRHGYKMAAATGSFAETGNAAGLKYGRKIGAGVGTFAETGNAAGLRTARKMPAALGTFSETGNSAGLLYGHKIAAGLGTFTLTGNDATLTKSGGTGHYSMSAEVGTFAETGIAVGLKASRKIPTSVGAFVWTGNAAGLKTARKIAADTAAYAFTGIDAGLRAARKLSATTSPFTETGYSAGLYRGRRIAAALGTFTLTGNAILNPLTRKLIASTGSFVLSGLAADLVWSGEPASSPFLQLAQLRIPKEGDWAGLIRYLWDFRRICQGFQNLDDLPAGSTYGLVSATALDSSGRVDMSKTGVVQKTLANIADSADDTRKAVPLNSHTGAARAYGALDSNSKLTSGTPLRTKDQIETTVGSDGYPDFTYKTQDNLTEGSTYKRVIQSEKDGGARGYAGLDSNGKLTGGTPLRTKDQIESTVGSDGYPDFTNKNISQLAETTEKKILTRSARDAYFRAMPSHGVNLIPNGGFEAGLDFWSVESSASIITDASKAYSGNKYCQLTAGPGVGSICVVSDEAGNYRFFDCVPGQVFNFYGRAYIETPGAGTYAYLVAQYFNKDKVIISSPNAPTNTSGSWQNLALLCTIPANCYYVRFYIYAVNATTTQVTRFDELSLVSFADDKYQRPILNDITGAVRGYNALDASPYYLTTGTKSGATTRTVANIVSAVDSSGRSVQLSLSSVAAGTLDNIPDGTTYKLITPDEKTGGARGYNAIDGSPYYITTGVKSGSTTRTAANAVSVVGSDGQAKSMRYGGQDVGMYGYCGTTLFRKSTSYGSVHTIGRIDNRLSSTEYCYIFISTNQFATVRINGADEYGPNTATVTSFACSGSSYVNLTVEIKSSSSSDEAIASVGFRVYGGAV